MWPELWSPRQVEGVLSEARHRVVALPLQHFASCHQTKNTMWLMLPRCRWFLEGLGLRSSCRVSKPAYWANCAYSLAVISKRHPHVVAHLIDQFDGEPLTRFLQIAEAARRDFVGGSSGSETRIEGTRRFRARDSSPGMATASARVEQQFLAKSSSPRLPNKCRR